MEIKYYLYLHNLVENSVCYVLISMTYKPPNLQTICNASKKFPLKFSNSHIIGQQKSKQCSVIKNSEKKSSNCILRFPLLEMAFTNGRARWRYEDV